MSPTVYTSNVKFIKIVYVRCFSVGDTIIVFEYFY